MVWSGEPGRVAADGRGPGLPRPAPRPQGAPGGVPRVAFGFTITNDKVRAIDLIADAEQLGRMELLILSD